MKFRDRFHQREAQDRPAPRASAADRASQYRNEGKELLAAGDEAIEQVLSQDSATFLSAIRQEGGQ